MPAAARAAAPTASQTRRRGLIRSDGIRVTDAIFRIAMPTYRELLQQVRTEISEVDASRARELVDAGEPVIVDVREQDEWDEGHIPGAVHIARGHLE
jgi:predicted sulfurtransferase